MLSEDRSETYHEQQKPGAFLEKVNENVRKDKYLLLLVSVLLYYFIFHYVPMYGQ